MLNFNLTFGQIVENQLVDSLSLVARISSSARAAKPSQILGQTMPQIQFIPFASLDFIFIFFSPPIRWARRAVLLICLQRAMVCLQKDNKNDKTHDASKYVLCIGRPLTCALRLTHESHARSPARIARYRLHHTKETSIAKHSFSFSSPLSSLPIFPFSFTV